MIERLKPYSAYRDSKVPWLGLVPSHWKVVPNRNVFHEVNDRNYADEKLLSVTISSGVVPQRSLLANSSKKDTSNQDKSGYKLVSKGDIVYNKMRAWQGALGVSRFRGIVSPAYVVMRPRNDHVSDYFHYLFRTPGWTTEAERWSYGITSDQWSLRPEHFKMIYSPLPPQSEQIGIVRFLDHISGMVLRLVKSKQQLIRLLNEQMQSVIDAVLINGLDPGCRLKPTGVEWLGEVPEHWRLMRLKHVAQLDPSKSESRGLLRDDEPVTFLAMADVDSSGRINSSIRRRASEVWAGFTYFRRNDVLLAKITPCFENGKGASLHSLPTEIGFGSTEFIVLRPGPLVTSQFLYLLTRLSAFRQRGAEAMTGATGHRRVPLNFVANFVVPIPPFEEQYAIVRHLDTSLGTIRQAISKIEKEISLIREYHARITTDVVTGKLDVRTAATAVSREPAVATESENFVDDCVDTDLGDNDLYEIA